MIITQNAPLALRGPGPLFGRAYLYAGTNVGSHIQLGFGWSTRVLNGKSSGIIGGYAFFGFGFHSYGSSTLSIGISTTLPWTRSASAAFPTPRQAADCIELGASNDRNKAAFD